MTNDGRKASRPATEVEIRDAIQSDADAISELTIQLGYSAGPDAIRSRLARLSGRRDQLVIVAILEERIAGWLHMQTSVVLESGFRAEIVGLVVAEYARRRSVGRSLVQRAELWALELGAGSVVVRSNTARIESHHFYPALGFTSSKTQSVYRKSLEQRFTPEAGS